MNSYELEHSFSPKSSEPKRPSEPREGWPNLFPLYCTIKSHNSLHLLFHSVPFSSHHFIATPFPPSTKSLHYIRWIKAYQDPSAKLSKILQLFFIRFCLFTVFVNLLVDSSIYLVLYRLFSLFFTSNFFSLIILTFPPFIFVPAREMGPRELLKSSSPSFGRSGDWVVN